MIFKNILKKSIGFFKRRKKLIYSVIGLLLLFFFVLHFSYYPLLKYTYKSSDTIEKRLGIDVVFNIVRNADRFYSMFDVVSKLRIKKNLFDGNLPIYDLKFSENDIKHFNEISKKFVKQGFKDGDMNTWRNVKLSVDGKNYDIKVKLHGDRSNHWAYEEKSYRIKSSNKDIDNMERFNLILFEDRFLWSKITRTISNYFKLYDIRDNIVVLRINGVSQGLYYLQESLDENFLENNLCSNCIIVKRTDEYGDDHYLKGNHGVVVSGDTVHMSYFDYDISSIDTFETELDSQKLFYKINDLFEVIQKEDSQKLLEFFDFDQLSSFEAMRRILFNTFDYVGDNLRLVYSASTGKFHFIPSIAYIKRLKLRKGGIENAANSIVVWDGNPFIPMFYLLSKNDRLRHETNKKIYGFVVNHKDDFLKEQQEMCEKYTPYALSYDMKKRSPTFVKFLLDYDRVILEHNLDLLQKNLEYATMYLNVIKKDNNVKIEIIPDSISQLKFKKIKLVLDKEYLGNVTLKLKDENGELISDTKINVNGNTVNLIDVLYDIYFAAGLDDELYPEKRVYTLEVSFVDKINKIKLLNLDVSIINDVTRQSLAEDDIYFNIADGDGYYPEMNKLTFEEFRRRYPDFRWQFNEDGLTLKSGTYKVVEDLIIPGFSRFLTFIIEDGTKLLMAEGVSIVSYSSISVDNVVVTAIDKNKPFGTFGVVGDGSYGESYDGDYKCEINNLDISYGSEKFIEGISFSGALSIHKCDTIISNSNIHDNKADDGLNIKYGSVILDNNEFFNNFADQVDLDFTKGIVKGNEFFVEEGENSNGDGLDLSGSSIIVYNNQFKGFVDKGVSIGEKTNIILFENVFSDNNWGSAVKDSSHAFFISNNFENNNIAINAYQKKQLFDGGFVYESNNIYNKNGREYNSDKKSEQYKLILQDEGLALIETLVEKEEIDLLFKFLEKRAEVAIRIE